MSYETDCPCGAVMVVKATDAGSLVTCRCGRQVEVPPLSRLRALDRPRRSPVAPPPAEYGYLRVPGFIVALMGIVLGVLGSCALGSDPEVRLAVLLPSGIAQMVGIILVGISKRFPVWLCVVLAPFGCLGLIVALFLPERLPPSYPV